MPVVWAAGAEKALKRTTPGGIPALDPEYIAFSNAHGIIYITGGFFAAASIIVILRCYVRIVMLKVFGKDDYIMIVSLVSCRKSKQTNCIYLLPSDVCCGYIRLLRYRSPKRSGQPSLGHPSEWRHVHELREGAVHSFTAGHGWHLVCQNLCRIFALENNSKETPNSIPTSCHCLHRRSHIRVCWHTRFSMLPGTSGLGFDTSTCTFGTWTCPLLRQHYFP